jgi:hypothetical protein
VERVLLDKLSDNEDFKEIPRQILFPVFTKIFPVLKLQITERYEAITFSQATKALRESRCIAQICF